VKGRRLLKRDDGVRSTRRALGRHGEGYRPRTVAPRVFDPTARAQAAQLDQLEPGWLVWYGVYDRLFYAIARTGTADPACIGARTPDALRALMREAESTTKIDKVS
jgi:hypothetical protein